MTKGSAIAVRSVPYLHSTFLPEISASVASRGLAGEASRGQAFLYTKLVSLVLIAQKSKQY